MVFVIFLEKNGKRYYQKKRFVPRAEPAGGLMPKYTLMTPGKLQDKFKNF